MNTVRVDICESAGLFAQAILKRSVWQFGFHMHVGEDGLIYVPTRQGWLYMAVLMDLYSRRIVGWAMEEQMTTTLTLRAVEMTLQQRPMSVGLLYHSDRGSQYGALTYQHRVATRGIRCSMSRPGN